MKSFIKGTIIILLCIELGMGLKHKLKITKNKEDKDEEWKSTERYIGGQSVTASDGKKYTCKAWPYEGMCSVYDPTILYGHMAWEEYKSPSTQG